MNRLLHCMYGVISVSKFEIPDASVRNFMQAVKNFMQAVKTLCKRSKTSYLWPKLRTSVTGRENFMQAVLKSKFMARFWLRLFALLLLSQLWYLTILIM